MSKIYESKCNGETIRGTADKIVQVYEGKAYACQRANDKQNEQIYFQHAEHWKRIKNE